MKKWISLGLAVILCLFCTACGNSGVKVVQPPEEVEIDTLLSHLDNQAKAQLNVGKATTMFVTIETVYSDYCVVSHQFRSGRSDVYMETELLAQLDKGQYAALYGVVDSVTANGNSFRYVFKDGRVEDMALFDAYVAKKNYGSLSGNNDYIFDREDFLKNYVKTRGGALRLDGNEIKAYLPGKWERRINQRFSYYGDDSFTGTHTPEITFYADGTYTSEHFENNTSRADFMSGRYDEPVTGNWEIDGDFLKLHGYMNASNGNSVHKISENVFIYDGEIFVRRT